MTTNGLQNGDSKEYDFQHAHVIHLPDRSRDSGIEDDELLAEAISYLHHDGLIILENAINPVHIEALSDLLLPEAEEVALDPDHHFNFGKETRNMDQAPPLKRELMFKDVWANPAACSILEHILGPQLVCHYANGNTALGPATGRQPVHSDIDKPHPMYPFAYILNIPLCDVTVENGATEIWLGSHRDSCIDQHTSYAGSKHTESGLTIKPSLLEARRRYAPPINPSVRKGSITIRDVRLWHAGVPNLTHQPRIMLAYVVQPKWFQGPSKVLLPLKVKDLLDQWESETGLRYNAQWVEGEVDHRKVTSDEVDFATNNNKMLELQHLMHAPAA